MRMFHPGAPHPRHPRRGGPSGHRHALHRLGRERRAVPVPPPSQVTVMAALGDSISAGTDVVQQSVGLPGEQLVHRHDCVGRLAPLEAQAR